MREEQKIWFDNLYNRRNNTATTLMEDFAISNMWNSVVEKYSDQAHFIYELLQNANDAKATESKFELTKEGLYFRHNGTKNFWVSNPDDEKEDQQNNKLGDINSITAVAQSNKKDQSTIGKFGVGFKAVFQYTQTPHIYEPNFQFKIDRFIVPVQLDTDLSNRKNGETIFYFPFNKNEMSPEKAYSDILEKLKKLVYPTLFLSSLEEVKWSTETENGEYTKNSTKKKIQDNIIYEKIELYQEIGLEQTKEKLYLFTSFLENGNHAYSVGYFLDEEDKLTPKQFSAFCFFPTKETTNLNFILNAPFLLTDSREGIHRSKEHNAEMVELLVKLAVNSLPILRDLKLIDDDIIKIIPYKKTTEDDFFAPFYTAIKEKFQTEALLPGRNGTYAAKENTYWASVPKIAELFSDEQLTDILDDGEINKWVFTSKGRDEILRGDKELAEYIDSITNVWLNEEDILTGWSYEDGSKQKGIMPNFIEKQNNEWLFSFYSWIMETEGRKKLSKEKPFFLNQERKAVSVFNNIGKLNLFLPDSDGNGYETLNKELFANTGSILEEIAKKQKGKPNLQLTEDITQLGKEFYAKFSIREHTVSDEIDEAILRFENNNLDAKSFFFKTFKYFKDECPQNEIDDFIEKIEDFDFIPFYNTENGFACGRILFYPTDKLIEFYKPKPDIKFANVQYLKSELKEEEHKTLDEFLKKLGVKDKDPDLKDEIYNIIIPRYKSENNQEIEVCCKDLQTILKYYQECPNNEIENFIIKLNFLSFLLYKTYQEPESTFIGKPQDLYFPTENLLTYFETKPDTKFIDLEDYHNFIIIEKEQHSLKELLLKLGVNENPKIIEQRSGSDRDYEKEINYILDGCESCINETNNKDKSLVVWNILQNIPFKELQKLEKCKKYTRPDARYNFHTEYILSPDLIKIRKSKWLIDENEILVEPCNITTKELSDAYEKESYQAKQLIDFLQFKPLIELTETERIAQKFESEEEAEFAKKLLEEYKTRQNSNPNHPINNGFADSTPSKSSRIAKTIKDLDELQNEFTPKKKNEKNENQKIDTNPEIHFDEDEEFTLGIEELKKQLEIKKSRVDLSENIKNSVKYSYDWFKAYLQLLTTYGDKQDSQKQKSISFQQIKQYKTDNKYFLLSGANNYISPEIEDANDFKISLVFANGEREYITVEGVSKKGQDLLIYCRETLSTSTINQFSNIFKVEINFTPVIDLLERLYKAFTNKNYIDEWQDIELKVPSLNYIYGPPGTGKTTTICNKIKDILVSSPNTKFLVLTPTNKAADVVCKKLLDINSNISTVRLSSATDPDLEEYEIYVDTICIGDMDSIDVVASTIHRLPYFDIKDVGLLFQYQWDYVIFDESSMTGLHYITFAIMALFKTNPNINFIIAGDPKQIPPVIEINEKELENFDFQDENIYKMMKIESFDPAKQIIREEDSIENLATQYRSILEIGQLFSELSYSNLLIHDRATNRKDRKPLPEKFQNLISSNVTFIDIPLDKDNSIYKINKLFYSSYHIYCTILVSEIIKYFDKTNTTEEWTIGLIAPYKAQAILLNKMITSYGISEKVKVYADTVHGFQGDECDIIFFICNPNNYFYSGHEKALLSKEYIYNVAISRAKDYLVILHPYTAIKNNDFINKIAISYRNNFGNTEILNADEIEQKLFNNKNYIENNSYVSGHDNVNVFGLSEMKYFIKSNDTAVDIQLKDI